MPLLRDDSLPIPELPPSQPLVVITACQVIAAIYVLSISTEEYSQTRFFVWIAGYAIGCAVSLPVTYWRYLHRNQARSSGREGGETTSSGSWNGQIARDPNARLSTMDNLKMALDCFFAIWFIVGNVWIFGGYSSYSDAPNLHRLCLVFLTISSIGYAMPFILCSMISCCLPCMVPILGAHDDLIRSKGASRATIIALPTLTFKSKKKKTNCSGDNVPGVDDGGIVVIGTEKERILSGKDDVCCICLASYSDIDEVKELPCSHFFHTNCIDKWLKINTSCPLCKVEITGKLNSCSTADSS